MSGASLHRTLLRFGHWLRTRCWETGLARPRVCRILAIDHTGQVLMVRHSYGSPRWTLPGGGMGFHETALETARRELLEEIGCTLANARLLTCFEERVRRTTIRVSLVGGRFEGVPRADQREIKATAVYAACAIPNDCFSGIVSTIEQWLPQLQVSLAADEASDQPH